jgi:hypothetical protein
LATTCKKNEEQQDAKNNVELEAKWMKTIGNAFEEAIRRGRDKSIKA